MNDHSHSSSHGTAIDAAPATSASPPPPAAASTNAHDDVLKILADVEGQFARIRAAKKNQDDALSAMAERNRALRQAEEELCRLRDDLQKQQQSLQRDQTRLADEQGKFDDRRRHADEELAVHRERLEAARADCASQHEEIRRQQADLHSARVRLDDEHKRLAASLAQRENEIAQRQSQIDARTKELERERERIARLENECLQQRDVLTRRTSQVEQEQRDLTGRVQQAETNVGQLIKEVEAQQQQLADKSTLLSKAAGDAKELREKVRVLEHSLAEATKRTEQAEREATELARLADQERKEQSKRLAAKIEEVESARDTAAKELAAANKRVKGLEKQVAESQKLQTESEKESTAHRQKLETASKKLSEFAAVLAEHTPQLERGAAALMMVEEQSSQIDRLTQQLAEMKLRTDPEEIARRDQRITELTDALRQSRGQSVNTLGLAELERRNAELAAQVERLKVEAANATLGADEVRKQLQDRSAQAATGQVQDAVVAEQAARIAALSAEIEQLKSHSNAELKAQLEAQIKEHQQASKKAAKSGAAATEALRQRVAELEKELDEARAAAASVSSPGGGTSVEFAAKLREKAERVTAVAEHLRRRRQRLKKLYVLLHSQSADRHTTNVANHEALEQDHHQILELRRILAASEQVMVRRWARKGAVSSVAWIALLAVMCGVASWLVANHFFPARVAASVVLKGRTASGLPLTEEQYAFWQSWHSGVFTDKTFMQTLAKRMGERRMDAYSDASNLMRRLGNDLTIDTSQKGSMILTLAGTDPDEVTALTDIIASTIITESNRAFGHRNDAAWAVAPGERTENGRVRYAEDRTMVIQDQRFTAMLPIFGVMFVACLAFIGVVYTRLASAKRVFDQDHAAIFGEARPAAA